MKKLMSLCSMLMVLAMLLAACGNTPASGSEASPGPESAAGAAQEPSRGGADMTGEIRYYSMWQETEPQADVIKEAAAAFEEMYPGATVTIEWHGRAILDTIKASLDAGLVDMWDSPINAVVANFVDNGVDLSDMLAAPSDVLGGKSYNDVANPVLFDAVVSQSPNGKLEGIPYQPNILGVWYNVEMFNAAGITSEPQTWEELMDVCATLKDAGYTPFSVDDGYSILPFGMYIGHLKGTDFVKELVTNAELWDDEAVVQAAEAFQYMWDNGYYTPTTASNKYPAGQNEVAMGESAMYIVASYMVNEVLEITGEDFEWGCFAYPAPAGSVMPNTANTFGMQLMKITETCENPELAFAFATLLTTGEYDLKMSQECNAIPTAVDTEWPALIAAGKPVLDESTENVAYGFYINANPDFTPILKENLQNLYGGVISAEQFLENCKSALS